MDRREMLIGGAAAAAWPSVAPLAPPATANGSALRQAAHDGYIYTLPLIESATARAGLMAREHGRPGVLYHMRAPTTPATQRITTPNNDTLNSRAWFDLAQGAVRLGWPGTGDRYLSIALMDMWSNNFAVLGSRTSGPDGGEVMIVGPDAAAAPGAVRSPTRWIWMLSRILTTGGGDLAAVHALQDRFRVAAPTWRGAFGSYADRDADWNAYFSSAARLMRENPGPATDLAMLRRIAPLGLDRFDPARFDAGQRRDIAAGLADARTLLRRQTAKGPTVDGWMYPRATMGDFGQDYLYRAQTALNGFAALPNAEAIYLFGTGPKGDLTYDSAVPWRLRVPGDALPPSDAFWSLVMYRATPDGQFFLFDNPIDRYSVGDRTPGLRRARDGSVVIALQRDPPPAGDAVNWLPTPRDASFGTVFRVYRPGQAVLDRSWTLPPLTRG